MLRWLRRIRIAGAVTPGDDRTIGNVAADVAMVIGLKPALIVLAVVVVLVVIGVVVMMGVAVVAVAGAEPVGGSLSAIEEIPPIAAAAYTDAAAAGQEELGCTIDPAVVAAIGWVESRHGADRLNDDGDAIPPIIGIPLDGTNGTALIWDTDDGILDGDTVYDRAVGPTQFGPGTWASWGQDGNGDGIRNPQNIYDAAKSTVWYLCLGGPADLTDPDALAAAILRYNHSQEYLATVLAKAQEYRLLMIAGGGDASDLLAHPGFSESATAIGDLESGLVDQRLVSILYALATEHPIYVGVIKTGHYQCVGGGSIAGNPDCRESHHWHWRGADISVVNGSGVSNRNPYAYELVAGMSVLPIGNPIRPAEVGSPWPEFDPLAGFFHDEDHTGHIHLAVCGPRISEGVLVDTCR